MMNHTLRRVLLAIALALLLVACDASHAGDARDKAAAPDATEIDAGSESDTSATDQTDAPPTLEGTRWQLVEVAGTAAIAAESHRAAHLIFLAENQRVSGSTGVNRLTGSYTREGGMLIFGPLAMTRMAGPEPLMKQEQALAVALAATRSFVIEADHLVLRGEGDQPLARFKAVGKAAPV